MRSKLALLIAAIVAGACSSPPERLMIEGRTITIFNDSREAWKAIEVWVNDHYRVTRETMAPGERFVVPLETFVAGFGQRFARNQHVTGIEVTATDESGDPVRVVWGHGRRR
jgi:putative intracellular protease/amidase